MQALLNKCANFLSCHYGSYTTRSTNVNVMTVCKRAITERERAEKQFRQVIEGAPNGMVMVDREVKITLVNAQIEQSFSYSSDELLRQRIEMGVICSEFLWLTTMK